MGQAAKRDKAEGTNSGEKVHARMYFWLNKEYFQWISKFLLLIILRLIHFKDNESMCIFHDFQATFEQCYFVSLNCPISTYMLSICHKYIPKTKYTIDKKNLLVKNKINLTWSVRRSGVLHRARMKCGSMYSFILLCHA